MIIDKLILHNFGVYGGRHEIELTPASKQKPIILFGGLNGGGKTTFMDALLLVLYGKFAKCSNRGNLAYDEFLRKCINRNVSAKDGAAIELGFRHRQSNVEEEIRINRSWRVTGKGIREDISVYRDGQLDPECTERWYEFVEELIPSRIANLFFFDGEKIEDLATPEQAASLIRTGIHALLGLDLIETLEQDLRVVERRRKAKLGTTEDQIKLNALTEELDRLESARGQAIQERASLENQLLNLEYERRRLEQSYKDQGGDLFDQRKDILDAHERATRELMGVQDRMRDIASGDAPLLLVEDLLERAYQQCLKDKESAANKQSLDFLKQRDAELIKHMTSKKLPKGAVNELESFLTSDRKHRQSLLGDDPIIGIEPEAFASLTTGQLDQTRQTITELLTHATRVEEELALLDRRLESIPDPEGLTGITKSLGGNEKSKLIVEHKLTEAGEKIDQLSTTIDRKQAEIDKFLDSHIRSQFAHERSEKVISQAEASRHLLREYRNRMCSSHIKKLQELVLDSYSLLMRKQSLVNQIRIDPDSFELALFDTDRRPVPLERLSAGERQLLATAILWGLSKASGRPLPTVIDTPLGRLDGKHRENLVSAYFPAASHQVILLSTDKEVDDHYYEMLGQYVGREYSIKFDDSAQTSQVVEGYLWKGAA